MIQQGVKKGTTAKLRYNVKSRLAELPEVEKNRIIKAIKADCGISRATMSRYINERKNTRAIMPANVLQAFATALGVTMEDLLNK
jgi:hypothetical protein